MRRASAAIPCRIVRFTLSMKAVFSRPEKPNPCKAVERSACVPRRITCETRTSLRQRSDFLHLTIDQSSRHLPPKRFPPSPTHLEPLSKMGRERIEVDIQAITGEERNAERRPGSVGASG